MLCLIEFPDISPERCGFSEMRVSLEVAEDRGSGAFTETAFQRLELSYPKSRDLKSKSCDLKSRDFKSLRFGGFALRFF